MKIVGIMVVGGVQKYLENSLNEFKRLCDDALIVTNNADESTLKIIEQYGYRHYNDDREWGIHQPDIKTDLLTKATELNPEWIIALDSDEVFAPEFTRAEAERLANTGEIAYNFLVVNLYNDPQHFTHGEGIQRFWNIRFYKFLPKYGLQFQRKSLHCGLGPPLAYKFGWHAPYYLLHYGLMDKADRERKALRYQKYDPSRKFKAGEYYNDLSRDLPMFEFKPQQLLAKLKESKECMPRLIPKRVLSINQGLEINQ